ncbi:MAG: FecR domain-containing protein [Sphingobium sp.]|nr:FecR domain-containing protein [Sphingobium sp.]
MSRHAAIEDKAIDWLIRRDEPDWSQRDQIELDAWLAESMANRAAYLRAEHGWAEAERVRSLGDWDERRAGRGYRPISPWLSGAIAASLLAVVGLGAYSFAPQFVQQPQVQEVRFQTPVGARKIINLADGSRIELNTQSVVRAAVDDKRRDVWLDSGEAYFEVTHREGEPFVVHAGKRTITVLGTKFSVRRDRDRVTVNVIEGRVRVDDGQNRDTSAAIITAGDTAIARGESTLIAAKSEERVENALAWRDGMLTFNLVPLSEAAAEFNRYNRTQLSVDPSAAAIPIGGTFQASNVEAFARLLHDAYGLKSEQDGDRIKISN